jgi:outer membrane protein OmpA-like peptidoglycan-associated protein
MALMRCVAKLPLFSVGLALLAACAVNTEPVLPAQPVGQTHTTAASLRTDTASMNEQALEVVHVTIASRLRDICHMPEIPVQPSVYLFNGADLKPKSEDILYTLATCLNTPLMMGKRICVAGYLDPRGRPQYEADLGRAHAFAAVRYLQRLDVQAERLDPALRNSAVFTDGQRPRPDDRRVELDVEEGNVCPGRLTSPPPI